MQSDIQNGYGTLSTIKINPTLINPPDLQYFLYDTKDQLQSNPRLDLPVEIETSIWRYYKFLKIQTFVLTDTLLF